MQLFQAELRAAIGEGDRCALCMLMANADRSHMRSFLREHGSDSLVLEPIHAAWGFCSWHTWALALMEDGERGGVLAMALLADDLLRHLASIVEAAEGASNKPLPTPPFPGPNSTCAMCRAMREEERYWVKHLTDARPSQVHGLPESPRFCAPHLLSLTDAQATRAYNTGRWSATLRSVFVRRAAQQAYVPIPLLPVEEDAGTVTAFVARACGVRELTARFSHAGDALAPLDDTPSAASRPSGRNSVICAVCMAEISAARTLSERFLGEFGGSLAALSATPGVCHGHRWLLADMAASAENGVCSRADRAEPSLAAQSICLVCHACWDAASESLRTLGSNAARTEDDHGCLCLNHWRAAERLLSGHGREADRLGLRHAQRRWLAATREDLRNYLDYFSVSTRDPNAPPPGTFAWHQAITFLVGMRPQGQCRSPGDS